MRSRVRRVPSAAVELFRLLVVVFCAGAGFEVARLIDRRGDVLGPFNGVAAGVIVGSGIGYVLGGVLGRKTVTAVDRTEATLREVSAESLGAGAMGLVGGVVVGAAVAWPVFFLGEIFFGLPLFAFAVAGLGLTGLRLGVGRRDAVIALFGAHAGLAPRSTPSVALPRIVDTSVAIDGRILDVVRAGFLHGRMLILRPVLAELQGLADAGDDLRRGRGRRGLEVLEVLRREVGVEVELVDDDVPAVPEVDAKLVRACLDRSAALLTLDTNLAKAAALAGVQVLNLHALTLALRPAVSAGENVSVLLTKPGKEAGQAVGYLDDGTMVVVERSRDLVGEEVSVRVTSVLTTANGRMVFASPHGDPPEVARPGPRRRAGTRG
ncbi:MAG: PIN/TRAM domain-containing protein [Mycobacteriales bacterium]